MLCRAGRGRPKCALSESREYLITLHLAGAARRGAPRTFRPPIDRGRYRGKQDAGPLGRDASLGTCTNMHFASPIDRTC